MNSIALCVFVHCGDVSGAQIIVNACLRILPAYDRSSHHCNKTSNSTKIGYRQSMPLEERQGMMNVLSAIALEDLGFHRPAELG